MWSFRDRRFGKPSVLARGYLEGGLAMARTRRPVSIDEKIAAAKEQVVKAKARYDKAAAELRRLIEKRDAMRKDELLDAVVVNGKSYDDILAMVRSSGDE